ncbi:MAG: uroporphyrinogen-III synthase [Aquificae bacterium]|nr:uroporphyrinogen-III synthase [Aquificota bacterium]
MKILLVSHLNNTYKGKEAEVIHFPTIKTVALEFGKIDAQYFDVLLFTSTKGIKYFFQKENPQNYKEKFFIAVGEKTLTALEKLGFSNVHIPKEQTAQGIVTFLEENYSFFKRKKILFPRAKDGRREILQLKDRFDIFWIDVYSTVINIPKNKIQVKKLLGKNHIDAVCFTSPMTFKNFSKIFENQPKEILKGKVISSIGKTTQKEIEKAGIKVSFVPKKASVEDLVKGTVSYIASKTST